MRDKVLKKREAKKLFVNQQIEEMIMLDAPKEPERPRILTMNSPRTEAPRTEPQKSEVDSPKPVSILKDIVTRVA